jgi:hypothetical protein
MEIFNVMIFGNDAKDFLKLCKEKKREWILKNTYQRNETLINEFINNPKISKECKCLDCGKNDKNISETNAVEVATVVKVEQTSGNGGGGIAKRRKHTKKT